ncbi:MULTISPECIES: hypothetical protein [unclassified Moorena]|uniref:hypothetical protein n=1 Tax=unclassified Moorena TaxID=2683338 RepID=UPI0013FFF769|nr:MULTISPECIES: hypothetical protein [unclassified Moorena]NEO17463.1 hypothetical protein [Moorena sp. SIO3E8]NEQ04010.1 hypothetical protein [Moorena sp. SIO3F7]
MGRWGDGEMGRWGDGEIFIKGNYPDMIQEAKGKRQEARGRQKATVRRVRTAIA